MTPTSAPLAAPPASLRVVAAMSGGVDSAVAAARMVEAGHEVTGVHLALSPAPAAVREGARGCCTLDDARDARRAADVLGIPFYVWDLAERFGRDVVEDFVAQYAAGRTPNPCLRCNERIKFAAVLDRAVALGFDGVVTGHHARLEAGVLRRSVDPGKDQSYVLGTLRADQLARAWFPLGDSTKAQVRAEAHARGLSVADKPDSHDVCFIPSGDTAGWLRGRLGTAPGPVLDGEREVGRHAGAYQFTVGQRRGLGLSVPAAGGAPRYVLAIEPATATVRVGPVTALDVHRITAGPPTWAGPAPTLPLRCTVQLRAHGAAHACCVEAAGDGLAITLDTPARGVAPGQAAVLYDGDAVLGGARVEATA